MLIYDFHYSNGAPINDHIKIRDMPVHLTGTLDDALAHLIPLGWRFNGNNLYRALTDQETEERHANGHEFLYPRPSLDCKPDEDGGL